MSRERKFTLQVPSLQGDFNLLGEKATLHYNFISETTGLHYNLSDYLIFVYMKTESSWIYVRIMTMISGYLIIMEENHYIFNFVYNIFLDYFITWIWLNHISHTHLIFSLVYFWTIIVCCSLKWVLCKWKHWRSKIWVVQFYLKFEYRKVKIKGKIIE